MDLRGDFLSRRYFLRVPPLLRATSLPSRRERDLKSEGGQGEEDGWQRLGAEGIRIEDPSTRIKEKEDSGLRGVGAIHESPLQALGTRL